MSGGADRLPNVLETVRSMLGNRAPSASAPLPLVRRRPASRRPLSALQYNTYCKDVVLLNGPSETIVPKQGKRLALHNAKQIIQGFEIDKSWTVNMTLTKLSALFVEKLNGTRCVVLISCGHFLVEPNLPPGQVLDALTLKKCLKSSGSVYLRPVRELVKEEDSEEEIPNLTDDEDCMIISNEQRDGAVGTGALVDEGVRVGDTGEYAVEEAAVEGAAVEGAAVEEAAVEGAAVEGAAVEEAAVDMAVDGRDKEPTVIEDEDAAVESAYKAACRLVNNQRTSCTAADVIRSYRARLTKHCKARELDVVSADSVIEGGTFEVYVSRTAMFANTVDWFADMSEFDTRLPLEVNFATEVSVDFGGPRKEFFKLFLREAADKLLDDYNLVENELYISLNHYYVYGLLIGMSILQGGLVTVLRDWGGEGAHFVQLREGLKRSGILKLMTLAPIIRVMTDFVIQTHTITPFLRTFQYEYAAAGSNRRRIQEQVYNIFVRYCREVYAGRRNRMTLEKILAFATGSEYVPLLGFTIPPKVLFVELPGFLPTANTCSNSMNLPVPGTLADFPPAEFFYDKFDLSFENTYFGFQ